MAEQINSIALHEAASERYLNYALSVITSRALPDVRDGFKPVQRRILYSMFHDLRLTHDSKHRKSAAVVGRVMANYHPHGDQSIYDAMVRMAQSFSLRYPLVDGQGNFGSLDGDGAAAMRYTEARLQSISERLLEELGKRTVAMRPNYDGQTLEPVVLPSQLPNLLLNGATGIAVGLATNIPPHNLRELVKACIKLIDDPELDHEGLMRIVKGPDFPTGGRVLNDPESISEIYEKGSGSFKIVGEYEVEEAQEKGQPDLLVVTSIPFTINKATLVEKIAEHIRTGKIPQLVDIRDESTDEVRIVMELAPGGRADAAAAFLYKNTPLQSRFSLNMTCLIPHMVEGEEVTVPARVGLREVLDQFLKFRHQVVTRRLRYDLEQLEKRIHLLEAFELIFGALDEAIALIRGSDGKADARQKLQERFGLDEVQSNAILDTRLYKLARMEIEQVRLELAEKRKQAQALRELLGSDEALWALIKDELRALSKKYGDKRRTTFGSPSEELEYNTEDYIVKEEAVVIVTREGRIKRQRSYSTIDRLRVRENDEVGWVFRARTDHAVCFFTNWGQVYTLRAETLPSTSGYGDPIQAHFDFKDGERIVGVACTDPRYAPGATDAHWEGSQDDPPEFCMVALTRAGNTTRFTLEAYAAPSNRSGRSYIRLLKKSPDGRPDQVMGVSPTAGNENVCMISHRSRCLIFPVSDVPLVKGRGKGVSAISLEDKDFVLGFCLSTSRTQGLVVQTNRGREEIVRATKFPIARRGRKGRPILLRGFIAEVANTTLEIRPPGEEVPSKPSEKPSQSASGPEEQERTDLPSEPPDAPGEPEATPEEVAPWPSIEPAEAATTAHVVYDATSAGPADGAESGDGEDQMTLF